MKIKYKNSLVAFVDVLGFSNLVYSKKTDKIEAYYGYIVSYFHKLRKELKCVLISDSIVIYGNNSKENLNRLFQLLAHIQARLLSQKILLRGAISFGDLYVNKKSNIIVGEALIKAYMLEKEAIYPRIILDRELIPANSFGTGDFLTSAFHISFEKNLDLGDGYLWIDYIRFITRSGNLTKNKFEPIYEFMRENYYSNIYYQKFKWIVDVILYWLNEKNKYFENRSGFHRKTNTAKLLSQLYFKKFSQL